jgi:signal transduction histidine kinase
MNLGIRHRLLTIVLLGVLTSALSVVALSYLLRTSNAQRIERAREALIEEAGHLARAPGQLNDSTPSGLVGMHAGLWSGDTPPSALAADWASLIRGPVVEARTKRDRVVQELPYLDGTLVVTAVPPLSPRQQGLADDTIVYAVYLVRPLPSLRTWQRIVTLLALLTVLLVGTALYSIVTVSRGASALRGALEALATDLRAPVPRPSVHELDPIAEGIAGLAKKLDDARVAQEKLARELAQNERLAALGRVAAGIAHEVRNPLASIKLRLDLAAASSVLPPSVEEALTHARSEIERLDRLVADLLFAAGRVVGPKGKGDLGALVRARAVALAPWATERGVTLDVSGDASASLDNDSMARAIDNLLRNAVEASPTGGRVDVRVGEESDEGAVRVVIEDTGEGIPSERAALLFEPFFTTKPTGTGLGLAIARAIARAHTGDVVYSRDGEKTRFTLSVASPSGVPVRDWT